MKTRKLINWILDTNPAYFLVGVVVSLIVISYGDYLIVGGQIQQCANITKGEIISLYFGRSLAEYLMLAIGILLGFKFGEDMKCDHKGGKKNEKMGL